MNGVEVANGNLVGNPVNLSARFEIGNYANGAGTAYDAIIDEVAVYSRMLQPAEVKQHYATAFARGAA